METETREPARGITKFTVGWPNVGSRQLLLSVINDAGSVSGVDVEISRSEWELSPEEFCKRVLIPALWQLRSQVAAKEEV